MTFPAGTADPPMDRAQDAATTTENRPPRPSALPLQPENIHPELKALHQLVVWRYDFVEEREEWAKVPYSPGTGKHAKTSFTVPGPDGKTRIRKIEVARRTWGTFAQVEARLGHEPGAWDGFGFVLDEEDPYFGIDLDKCRNPHTGEIAPWAQAIMDRFPGMYWEASPSGKGAKGVGRGKKPGKRCKLNRDDGSAIEIYDRDRFFTLTGHPLHVPECIGDHQAELEALYYELFPKQPERQAVAPAKAKTNGQQEQSSGGYGRSDRDPTLSDDTLIPFACRLLPKFDALWHGDRSGFPGRSEAVQSLVALLVWFVGNDWQRVESLFRRSGLLDKKWDEPRGDRTWGRLNFDTWIEDRWDGSTFVWEDRPRASNRAAQVHSGQGDDVDAPPPYPPGGYNCTDLGNAERLVHRHGRDLRHNRSFDWMTYDGKRWAVDDSGQGYRFAKATARSIYEEAAAVRREMSDLAQKTADLIEEMASLPPEGDGGRRAALDEQIKAIDKQSNKAAARTKELMTWAFKSEAAPRLEAAVSLAQTEPGNYAAPAAFDTDPMILNVQNGIVDLTTGELHPHRRDALCTKIAAVAYDPDATAPLWEACLLRWQPDPEVRAFLQRAAGYSLTGHTGEETAFLLYAQGRNGKSKFVGALEYILGDYAGRAPIELFMQGKSISDANSPTPDKAELAGKRLVIASEIMQSRRLNESFIKDLTGGDTITAAKKFRDPFKFKPLLKLWLYGNHKPIIAGTDDGIKARLPLIPFTVFIPEAERDIELDAKLRAEGAGILAWAVRGCLEWQKKRLSPPAAVVKASAEYHEEQDLLAGFFKARCIFGGEKTIWTPTKELRDELVVWARDEGVDEKSLPKPNEFGERLRREGCDDNGGKVLKHKGKPARCWSNVRLRTDADPADDPDKADPTCKPETKAANTSEAIGQTVTPVTPGNGQIGILSKAIFDFPMGKDAENGVTGVTGVTESSSSEWLDDDLTDPFGPGEAADLLAEAEEGQPS